LVEKVGNTAAERVGSIYATFLCERIKSFQGLVCQCFSRFCDVSQWQNGRTG